MLADAVPRAVTVLLISGLLIACQAREGASQAGPVAFVDVTGHRVVIDDAKLSSPQAVGSGAMVPIERAAAAPANVVGSSAAAAVKPDEVLDETNFIASEDFEKQMDEKAGDRFYLVPDGRGGMSPVTARTLAAGEPDPVVTAGGEAIVQQVPMLACPPAAAKLDHLLPLADKSRASTLDFPVYDPTLKTRQRYAGFRLKIPAGVTQVRLLGVLRNGHSPDVVVLQAADGVPLAVVNNYATESIPETPFRYAMVKGEMPVLTGGGEGRELIVIEGAWARRVLDSKCRPEQGGHTATGGRVVVEFVGNSTDDSKGSKR